MNSRTTEAAAERLRTTLELFEAGVEMKRAKIRRDNPGIAVLEVDRLIREWLRATKVPMEGVEGYRLREQGETNCLED